MYIAKHATPIGTVTLAGGAAGLTGLWIAGQKYHGTPDGEAADGFPLFGLVREWLDRYFRGERPEAGALPLAPSGSAFRQAVWALLRDIPYGETVTYGAIAKQLAVQTGRAVSPRAVGGAVGHNPVSILIPCHRVIGANRSLTGYASGLDTKARLLALEGICLPAS